ncbi:MAG: hypothetical protein LBT89_01890, partial [Planctomycetaceae bacterium]|nr:hypothetical protein [Planctomycetaceae bacterium]
MTGIQSSVGLISGIDYTSIVDQLIQLDSIPKQNLEYRTELLAAEESALANLMTLFLTSSYMIRNLNSIAAFQRCDVTSSNSALLIASKNGTPVEGTHTFTPLQLAAAQQTMAKGVVSDTDALGKTGTITVGKGWTLDNSVELQNLNGGSGVTKGSIRITDGSGTRATIDLRKAITIQDVVDAINDNDTIDVRAELVEDRLVLTDFSGGDLSKFLVQEVSGGTTAASLGIANLRADSDGVAVGASIYRLGEDMALSYLNDGNGVVFDDVWADIVVKCRDGSTVNIDFFYRATTAEIAAGAPEIHKETTVGDLIETINNSKDVNGAGGKVHARISDDGKSLVIEDTTQGANFTTLTQVSTNPVFKTLGLSNGDYSSGTVAPYMDGAKGGKILVKDKAGYEAAIEFTDAEIKNFKSFTEVAAAFTAKLHAANVSFDVTVNDTFNGLKLTETSGGPGSVTFTDDPSGSGNLAAFFGFNLVNDAAPAVPGVNAVSADDGTGGTAALKFADSSQMNGKTFAFTTDENLAGYDPATETLTVYLPPEIVDETDPDTQDALVEAAINAAIGADWAAMRPVGSTASASVVQPAGGLGAQAVADAVSGGQTAIKAEYGGVLGNEPVASIVTPAVPGINAVSANDGTGGTALLTFADTGKMNGKTFAFTTDENLAGYNSATETLMVYIPPEARAITPAVPGVNAVSADDGTGGTAVLMFADSSQMNGKTFAFTTDENLAGY